MRNRVVNPKGLLPILLLICFVLVPLHSRSALSQTQAEAPSSVSLPAEGQNNFWYLLTDSDTVFVFVHGIFSDSRGCWLYDKNGKQIYWPELIKTDPSFNQVSLYLAGYDTAIDSGEIGIRDAANAILKALNRPHKPGGLSVMAKKNILFIGHSTGGVVIRYMLENNYAEFANKTIGLVLIASPSYGSRIANYLDALAALYNQRLGQELKWRSWNLEDLDNRFKKLLAEGRIPRLVGIEGYETHFILHHKWIPLLDKMYIVSKESAGRYFEAEPLANTDHFETVKPNGTNHPGYLLLYDFYNGKFSRLVMQTLKAKELFEKAEQFRLSGSKDDAYSSYTNARMLYEQLHDSLGQAQVFRSLGDLEHQHGNNDQARFDYMTALVLYEQLHDSLGQAQVLRRLGDLESQLSEEIPARRFYSRALVLYEQLHDSLGQAQVLNGLGELEQDFGHNDEADKAYTAALKLYEQEKNSLGRARVLSGSGDLKHKLGENDQARINYTTALTLFEQIRDSLGQANVLRRIGDLERQLENYDQARKAYNRASLLYRQMDIPLGEANVFRSLGDLEYQLQNNDQARINYTVALRLYEHRVKYPLGKADMLRSLEDLEINTNRGSAEQRVKSHPKGRNKHSSY
jgi:tetratricopeptide (TPR) repeat protein